MARLYNTELAEQVDVDALPKGLEGDVGHQD